MRHEKHNYSIDCLSNSTYVFTQFAAYDLWYILLLLSYVATYVYITIINYICIARLLYIQTSPLQPELYAPTRLRQPPLYTPTPPQNPRVYTPTPIGKPRIYTPTPYRKPRMYTTISLRQLPLYIPTPP